MLKGLSFDMGTGPARDQAMPCTIGSWPGPGGRANSRQMTEVA